MVLIDYSMQEQVYSILEKRDDRDSMVTLEDYIYDFKNALERAREFSDDDFGSPNEIEEPVVSLSAVRGILRDFFRRNVGNIAHQIIAFPEEEKNE